MTFTLLLDLSRLRVMIQADMVSVTFMITPWTLHYLSDSKTVFCLFYISSLTKAVFGELYIFP